MSKKNSGFPFGYASTLATFFTFFILVIIGHFRDQAGKIFKPWKYKFFISEAHIPPLFTTFDSFFIRRLYRRISDCWNRPITGVPGRSVTILERKSLDYNNTFVLTGERIQALNIGSYNYLGFAYKEGEVIEKVLKSVDEYGINYAYPTAEFQQNQACKILEREIGNFLYQEDCIVYAMGYGTNTTAISLLMKDSLILSDEMNHTSLIKGIKLSGGQVVVFKHNSMSDLESKLVFNITQGEPVTHRPWKRIFVVVEGLYSMEGTIVDLRKLVRLKKLYKFYIYMDEAHSIGAMGKTGRGICEHLGVEHSEVDILMGTFTKSFGGFGGYITGKKEMIDLLRSSSDFSLHGEQMSPIVCTQILESLRMIKKEQGKLRKLKENTQRIRREMKSLGFHLLGDEESPIVPLLIPSPGKIAEFSRLCLERGIAVVVVGYPATPILLNRVRVCMSSSHTEKDIDKIVTVFNQIGNLIGMKK
ncbi:serine palmitoyltransferase component [Glugoides intestinalis]